MELHWNFFKGKFLFGQVEEAAPRGWGRRQIKSSTTSSPEYLTKARPDALQCSPVAMVQSSPIDLVEKSSANPGETQLQFAGWGPWIQLITSRSCATLLT